MRILAWLCAIASALGTAACSRQETGGTHGSRHAYTIPHVLRFAAEGDIRGLDAFVNVSDAEPYLGQLCAAYLIRTDAKGFPTVPELATEIPTQRNGGISADGKTITWHLRRGVKWSDGAPFSADDVVFSTRQVLNPANDIASRDGWNLIARVDEPDDYTVVYHLKTPYASYAYTFFSTGSATQAIVPKHLLYGYRDLNRVPYNAHPVGIGPFKYAEWKRGDEVVMVPNASYWRGVPKLRKIVFKIVPDRTTIFNQLRTHDLDLWLTISSRFFAEARTIPGITGIDQPGFSYDHFDFNLSHPMLRDLALRRALREGLNRGEILRKVQQGLNALSESYISSASPFYVAMPLVPFDVDKANALLDDDGWKRGEDGIRTKHGRRLNLQFAIAAGSPDTETVVELVRNTWQRLGVELTLRRYPLSLLFAPADEGGIVYGGKFDVVAFNWAIGPFPDVASMYACDTVAPKGQNDLFWCDRRATAQMKRLQRTYDFAEQKKASDAVVRAVADQVPTIIIDSHKDLVAHSSDLRNFAPNPTAPFDSVMNVDI